jgi:hypothetical protein
VLWVSSIVNGLLKPVGDIFKERESRKRIAVEAQANLDRILAEAASTDAQVAAQIALVNAQNQNNTWKDEFALITIAAPFWVAMVLGPVGHGAVVTEMFTAMSVIPQFWQDTFQWGILGALGITQLKKAVVK